MQRKIQSEAMKSTAKMPQKFTKTVLGQRPFDKKTSFVDNPPRKGLSWAPLIFFEIHWIVLTCIKTQTNIYSRSPYSNIILDIVSFLYILKVLFSSEGYQLMSFMQGV